MQAAYLLQQLNYLFEQNHISLVLTMTCKKSDLITAINSYAAAKTTGDSTLIALSVNLLQGLMDTLEFEEENVAIKEQASDEAKE